MNKPLLPENSPSYPHWKRIGFGHHHGFCIPLSAIRSEENSGIGEFPDLKKLVDWCITIKMDTIQLLPINEMDIDSSPYNAISSCALDPIYIGLSYLPYLEKNPFLLDMVNSFNVFKDQPKVHYHKIRKMKTDFLRKYFEVFFEEIEHELAYERFVEQNDWLESYALFQILTARYGTNKWKTWPKKASSPTDEIYKELVSANKHEMPYFYMVQFLAYAQMSDANNYATDKSINIMGDIPILLNPDSVDVWKDRKIFDLHHIAGVPPDMFNPDGQKWGFYLFNWDALKLTDYAWWRRRLSLASSLYHLYRVDHAVGFFRLWGILPKDSALQGKFLPKDPKKWEVLGRENFQMMLDASPLLPIAEDLGVIPPIVHEVLNDLGICGIKIMRWEVDEEDEKVTRYKKISEYPPLSLTTLGTHDAPTVEQWWQNSPEQALAYAKTYSWKYEPELAEDKRFHILWESHHTSSTFHINLIGEYLALFPDLVWENPEDERINRAGIISTANWTYRMRPTIESLIKNAKLTEKIHKLIKP